ncbi:uncharacterized protein LOC122645230 [Telopea speciosissima]|uniref:uncharacterized protein LOC122645230 n=1 Tax=Telopea speciosissima TaxID=54955 RepID=UPI001CC63265|nr:uncharacterized protein LOC122645230 [Telopea speciosissima]
MSKHGCNPDGSLNAASFAKPMPAMGVYVAGASLICFLSMFIDLITGFRRGSFHCRLFSLNSMTLTLLSVATKLAADLNSPMPSNLDQLSKLTGSVFICTAMANFMPSLATMSDSEIFSNIVSLVIFVVTVIVDICIQMGTGVIYVFLPEHIIVMSLMLLLLLLFCLSSLAVPATRQVLDRQYRVKLKDIDEPEKWKHDFGYLKAEMEKLWAMVHASSPQQVFGSFAICTAAGFLNFLAVVILVVAAVRSFVPGALSFCKGNSDYGWWSISTVFGSQCLAVFVGSSAPLLRWMIVVKPVCERCWKTLVCSFNMNFLDIFKGLKDHILKLFHLFKNPSLSVLTEQGKDDDWIRKLAIYLPVKYVVIYLFNFRETLLLPSVTFFLRHYPPLVNSILKEGERESVSANFQHGHSECERMINGGIKNHPCHLIKLLQKRSNAYNSVGLFKGVLEFDSYLVPPIRTSDCEIPAPPNCWTMPVVILTSIANSLGHSNKERMKSLIDTVREGLRFTKFIEDNLEDKSLISVRDAAEFLWVGMDYCTFFIDINLHKDLSSSQGFSMSSSPEEILKKLANAGKGCVLRSKEKLLGVPHVLWPIEVIIGYNLYRVCESILLDEEKYQTIDKLFDWIEHTIADLLGACLPNLPHALYAECALTNIVEAEERFKKAAYVLGQFQEIIQILRAMNFPELDHDESAYLENWRSVKQFKDPKFQDCASSPCNHLSSPTSGPDLV